MKKTFRSILTCLTILVMILDAPGTVAASADPVPAQKTSPAEMLNADGTLHLSGTFYGALDLDGWIVQMDPQHGPIFAPGSLPANTQWNSLGAGSDGSLAATVWAVAVSGTDVYVGGDFKDVRNDNSPNTAADYIARWDTLKREWRALGSTREGDGSLNNVVRAIAINGTDVYVGGAFTDVTNSLGGTLTTADYIAKWNEKKWKWSALGSNGAGEGSLNNTVSSIAISGTNVYVGGAFTNVMNSDGMALPAADYIAKWNGSTWLALGSNGAGNGSLNSGVGIIAVSEPNIYVGGSFKNVTNSNRTVLTAADYIAKWNSLTGNWSALGSNGAGDGSFNDRVRTIAISGANVYVGGYFTNVNNNGKVLPAADYIAKWNGSNWSALGSNGAGNGSLDGSVYAIAVNGANIYVGGTFRNVNNNGTSLQSAAYVAKWTGNRWSALASNGDIANRALNDPVYAFSVNGTNVYVGGKFTNINSAGTVLMAADFIANWNGKLWSALGGGRLQGSLSTASTTDPDGHTFSPVSAIAVSGMDVYVGGSFKDVHNRHTPLRAADYIAKWNAITDQWSALGSNGAGHGALNKPVTAIALSGTDVYVGGWFTDVNNNGTVLPNADYIAKWDTLTGSWSALGSNGAGNGSLNDVVHAIAVHGTNVYVGGEFVNVNNKGKILNAADYIARWNGAGWAALGSNGAGNGSLNHFVRAITVSERDVFVGGYFTDVNNNGTILTAADAIAKWDGSIWSALGSNGAGNGSLNNGVEAIAISGTNVYVGGTFRNVTNRNGIALPAADFIAQWNALTDNWSALGSNGAGDGALNRPVSAVAVNGTDVYMGGSFTDVNNNGTVLQTADYVVKWNGSSWSAISSNEAGDGSLNNSVHVIAISGKALFAGGLFLNVQKGTITLFAADYVAVCGIEPPATHTPTHTITATQIPTMTETVFPAITATPSPTVIMTETPTATMPEKPTPTETETPTVTPTS